MIHLLRVAQSVPTRLKVCLSNELRGADGKNTVVLHVVLEVAQRAQFADVERCIYNCF